MVAASTAAAAEPALIWAVSRSTAEKYSNRSSRKGRHAAARSRPTSGTAVGDRIARSYESEGGCTAIRTAKPADAHGHGSTVGDTASRSAAVTDVGRQQSRSLQSRGSVAACSVGRAALYPSPGGEAEGDAGEQVADHRSNSLRGRSDHQQRYEHQGECGGLRDLDKFPATGRHQPSHRVRESSTGQPYAYRVRHRVTSGPP